MNLNSYNFCKFTTTLLVSVSMAANASAASHDKIAGPVNVGSAEILSVTGGLISVIAAILLAGYLYSRMKGPRLGGNNVINIIASQALGPKEKIVLVEIADTQFAIGMTTSSVQTLHVFDKPVIKPQEISNQMGFADRLKDVMRSVRK